ncbi:RlmE family RNA methyltransferase [Acidocella aromatica]|uniref:Ribosomal RNA large subunit methyltransferase E n=1 Tax=Acidocella aromatica TaxID=1303579 RepID=A0A840VJ54_9PROT|nr:RlmE family RNA methyltransferase [Acidocella aromatica]MBB5372289.1 23S rRNA (uridine2552-2'-O)-methyltransferase [Acidocella aromatica]
MTSGSPLPPRRDAVRLKNARKLSPSSQRWLQRQLNDPYVTAAKAQGWRSRAAFKLIELDDKYHLITKGARVLDLGAAPGGWSQVALARGAVSVVGVDLLPIDPVAGAEFIQGDFLEEGMEQRLEALLGGKADLVMSDMAPNTSGHVATDHLRIMALAETALAFACDILAPEGAFVCKLFQGGAEKSMLDTLKLRFRTVRHAKPPASRKDSKEMYVVATGFRPG